MGNPKREFTLFLNSVGLELWQKNRFLVLDPPIMALAIDLVYVNEPEREKKIEAIRHAVEKELIDIRLPESLLKK